MASIKLRRNVDGSPAYHTKVRLKGHPPQHATFARLTDARRWAQSTEAAIREGRHFKSNEAKKHTLADAIARYRLEVMPSKPGCARSQPQQLDWWEREAGSYLLADVTPALIGEFRDRLLKSPKAPRTKDASKAAPATKRSPATVVRYLALLSHIFTVAIKEWEWVEDNPVRRVRKPKEPRGRVRFLSDVEREALLASCRTGGSRVLYTVVVLAISTGMRSGELMTLRWEQVYFERGAITLHKTKNGDRRNVPLTGLALVLLRDHSRVRRIDSKLIFPGENPEKPIDLKKPWAAARLDAGIQDFRFHDLRHCTASYLAMNGATLSEIADVLGHRTLSMVKRYTHIAESHSAKVVAAMNSKIFPAQTDAGGQQHG